MAQRHEHVHFASRDEARRVQADRFRGHVRYCAQASPFYRDLFRRHGLDVSALTLDDLHLLPTTDKADLEACNDRFLAVPMEQVTDIVQSSGTTGRPTHMMYTAGDLERLAYNERCAFTAAGLSAGDVVLLTCTMDRCFIAGLAYFLGLQAIGAAAIRNGHGTMEGHRALLQRMQATAIVGVPSFLRKLAHYLRDVGEDPAGMSVRRLICIGEPIRGRNFEPLPVGRDLAELWGAKVYSTYASSEIVTTFCECEACRGGHLPPDLGILEILDERGRPLPPGQVGEVVVTPLGTEGMPLLRFRTGDLSFVVDEPCPCGRTAPRLGPILGRQKQMIKIKGTTLYPEAIGLALEKLGGVGEYYVEVEPADVLSDRVTVHVWPTGDDITASGVSEFLGAHLRAKPEVVLEAEAEIRRHVFSPQYRKPMRFFDRRKA